MTAVEQNVISSTGSQDVSGSGYVQSKWKAFFSRPTAIIYLALLVLIVFAVVVGPLVAVSPVSTSPATLMPPSGGSILGTDELGRDYFSRVLHGGQASLLVGVSVALLCLTLGLIIGGIAGFYGGIVDIVLVRVAEFFQVIPGIILALVAAAILGTNMWMIVGILAFTMWPGVARIVRAEAMKVSQLGYVEAAHAAGFSRWRILVSDVLPNVLPPVLVATTMIVGRAILIESALAYLGVGDANNPSWGALLNDAQAYMTSAWWLAAFPGLLIFIVVLSINMIGDLINDVLSTSVGGAK